MQALHGPSAARYTACSTGHSTLFLSGEDELRKLMYYNKVT